MTEEQRIKIKHTIAARELEEKDLMALRPPSWRHLYYEAVIKRLGNISNEKLLAELLT